MRDVDDGDGDGDNDADADGDADADPEPDAESPSNASQTSEGAGGVSQTNAAASPSATNNLSDPLAAFRPTVRPECLTASTYDIVPTTAAPHSTSINAVTATADMRWVFSGGADGYIRKFNWVDSLNSKLMLTVAQRHPFVDSVIKAGVLMTYWENMDGNVLSPVYSLASQSQGLWLLSGLESGNIRLQTIRHEEGKEVALLQQHTSAVSALHLTSDEKSVLSGSWDKKVIDWDLNTGQSRRLFSASAGQVSAIQIRPDSTLPIPQDIPDVSQPNGTYSSNYQASAGGSFGFANGVTESQQDQPAANAEAGSPADSLFGGADSLFGDADGGAIDGGAPSGGAFGTDGEDELSRALANGAQHSEEDAHGEPDFMDQPNNMQDSALPALETSTEPASQGQETVPDAALPNGTSEPVVNGLPHAEQLESSAMDLDLTQPSISDSSITNDTTFLAASIDGTICVWDRRQQDPVARISPRNVPPWCMNACWSPDGNYIYAGRRNGTVEEFSLHKGLRSAERTFKFPQGSGAVTALYPMPNGRHLVW